LRIFLAIVGLLCVVLALVGIKGAQISQLMGMGKVQKAAGPPPEAVSTALAQEQSWGGTLSAVGSVTSFKGVSLSNDAQGLVTRINFESGAVVKQGQVLLELDTSVERAQLAQAQASQELAVTTVERTRKLVSTGAINAAQLDTDEAQLKTTTTQVESIQAQIGRKTLRAPFSGRLGIRLVNLGQYLSAGTPIATLEAIHNVYVDFTLPQQRLQQLSVGMPVHLEEARDETRAAPREGPAKTDDKGSADANRPGVWDGTIAAIDPAIDSSTRAIKLRATVPNKEEQLRPGMFMNVSVLLPDKGNVVTVPATAVVHAPFGDSVFAVEDKKADDPGMRQTPDGKTVKIARQQFVRIGESRGDFIAIVDGVKSGQEVVSAGAFKLRNGSPIAVDNKVQPTPQLSPRVENR